MDFKSSFDPTKPGFWCEIVKDLVSFANTRGGVIIFGLDSSGQIANGDCSAAEKTDVASIADQVTKYTDVSIGSLKKFAVTRSCQIFWCISCDSEGILIPFTKPGTYEVLDAEQKKKFQKNAFSIGTIYVRHGAKSEPCNRDDLGAWVQRELQGIRDEWLLNIRKVVEAPFGQAVVVTTSPNGEGNSPTLSARITNDPNAIMVRMPDPKQNWPHRPKDVLRDFKKKFPQATMNSHDLVAVRYAHEIDENKCPDLMLKTHSSSAPQFSDSFIDWLFGAYSKDSELFVVARRKWRFDKYGT